MKIAYLIVAYNNPLHLNRLTEALHSANARFFIHVDKKSDISPFLFLQKPGVELIKDRIPVFWGDYSTVEAVLNLLKIAISVSDQFDRFVWLTGSEYPLHSVEYIEDFFKRNRSVEFIDLVKMPSEKHSRPIGRISRYRLRPDKYKFLAKMGPFSKRVLHHSLALAGIIPKKRDYQKILGKMDPYGGETLWAITRKSGEYILDFFEKERKIVEFYKNTVIPEEMLFHTILGNSPSRQNIRRGITYFDWSTNGKSPAWIDEHHLEIFKNPVFSPDHPYGEGEMLFARKFSNNSEHLVKKIDEIIRNRG